MNPSLAIIKKQVKGCVEKLYQTDGFLFRRNSGRGICERGLTFRFAYYLQNNFDSYFVDCDFNSSFIGEVNNTGNIVRIERSGKLIRNEDGSETKRFVDIIIHKRDYNARNDFICFEIKKWNNNGEQERNKDYNNLRRLTLDYGYFYGFHIILGKTQNSTKWTVFQHGEVIIGTTLMFET